MSNKTHSTTAIRRPTEEPDNWGNKDRQDITNNKTDKGIDEAITNNGKMVHDCSAYTTHSNAYNMDSDLKIIREDIINNKVNVISNITFQQSTAYSTKYNTFVLNKFITIKYYNKSNQHKITSTTKIIYHLDADSEQLV